MYIVHGQLKHVMKLSGDNGVLIFNVNVTLNGLENLITDESVSLIFSLIKRFFTKSTSYSTVNN